MQAATEWIEFPFNGDRTMRERNTATLFLLGVIWLVMAVCWGYAIYNTVVRVPQILTFGLGSMLAGLFIGRGIQKMRDKHAAKTPPTDAPLNP
jgi:hypothetical protein